VSHRHDARRARGGHGGRNGHATDSGRRNPARHGQNERAIALDRKNYLFMDLASGGQAAVIAYTLIETARLKGIGPRACLACVPEHMPDYKINRVDELLPWNTSPAAVPKADR